MATKKKKAVHTHLDKKKEAEYIKFIKEIGAGKRRGFVAVMESVSDEKDVDLHTFGHRVTNGEVRALIGALIETTQPEVKMLKGLLGEMFDTLSGKKVAKKKAKK